MPIKIADGLPAAQVLENENVFIMTEKRATQQDIRPLQILILNLMPTKVVTETQLLRLLGNSPLQVDVELLQTATHVSKNTPAEHLLKFYQTFQQVRDKRYDGMIITGAPVENMAFEEVDYWKELCEIMEWSTTHVYSTMHICWGAQAGLYFHHNVQKYGLERKLSGIYPHHPLVKDHPLIRGFDDMFSMPHSRHTAVDEEAIRSNPRLLPLVCSEEAGLSIISTVDARQVFITGHFEYDRDTLNNEYLRDMGRGLNPDIPQNYFPDDDPQARPRMSWRGHANLLFSNWLNYFVYQQTPYNLNTL